MEAPSGVGKEKSRVSASSASSLPESENEDRMKAASSTISPRTESLRSISSTREISDVSHLVAKVRSNGSARIEAVKSSLTLPSSSSSSCETYPESTGTGVETPEVSSRPLRLGDCGRTGSLRGQYSVCSPRSAERICSSLASTSVRTGGRLLDGVRQGPAL